MTGLAVALWAFGLVVLALIYVSVWGFVRSLSIERPPLVEPFDVPAAIEVDSTPFPSLLRS